MWSSDRSFSFLEPLSVEDAKKMPLTEFPSHQSLDLESHPTGATYKEIHFAMNLA